MFKVTEFTRDYDNTTTHRQQLPLTTVTGMCLNVCRGKHVATYGARNLIVLQSDIKAFVMALILTINMDITTYEN